MLKEILLLCSFSIVSRHYATGQVSQIGGIDPSNYPIDLENPMNTSLQGDNPISNIQTPVANPIDSMPIDMSNPIDNAVLFDNLPVENPIDTSNPMNNTGVISSLPIENPAELNPIDMSTPMNNPIDMNNPMNNTGVFDSMPIENPIDTSNPMNNTGVFNNLPIENPTGINPVNSTQMNSIGVPFGLLSDIGF